MIDPMDRVKVSHIPDPMAHQHNQLQALRVDTRPLDSSSSQLTVPGGGSSMVIFGFLFI
jgi:hypothetical protein